MRLVWHIAKKDLRRMAAPVAVWLALIVAPTVAFVTVSAPIGEHVASSLGAWRGVLSAWAQMLLAVQFLIAYVLAGALVLEDPLVGSTVFWATRPIANVRLLAAKVLAAALLMIVAPVVALLPVWLASGFGPLDLCLGAAEIATRLGATVIVALVVASLVRTLGQFLLCSLILVAAFMATGLTRFGFWQLAPMSVRAARELLAWGSVLPVVAVIGANQFLTRRTARTWFLVAVSLLGIAVIRNAWPWEFPSRVTTRPSVERWPEARIATITAEPNFTKHSLSSNEMLNLHGTTMWRPEEFCAPVFARASESREIRMRSSGLWESEAGLRTLGFKDNAEPLRWQLIATGRPVPEGPDGPQLNGTLEIWSIRTRVIGELPLRVGAELAQGGHRIRILALVSQGERLDEIFLEEIEAHSSAVGDFGSNWSQRGADTLRHIDRYFVVNRATRKARSTGLGDIGSVDMNSLAIRFRGLGVTWTRNAADDVLVKIRFECERRFERALEVHSVKSTRPTP